MSVAKERWHGAVEDTMYQQMTAGAKQQHDEWMEQRVEMTLQRWSDMCDDHAVANGYAGVHNPRISKTGYFRATLVRSNGRGVRVYASHRGDKWIVRYS